MSEQAVYDQGAIEQKVSGSSFYAGMRILPKAERSAMFAIYGFCRAVDDIVDEPGGEPAERRVELDAWRTDVERLYAGEAAGRMAFLAGDIRRFGLAKADFQAVIDGMQMDLDEDIRAPDAAKLDLYCDRVASAVGRLSVKVFGMPRDDGIALAHHLGRALQLTNILRDIDEDAGIGRVYLPREALLAAGVELSVPEAIAAHPAIPAVCATLVTQAQAHFEAADAIMRRSPRRVVRAPRIMAAAYHAILMRLITRGWTHPRQGVKVAKLRLIAILLRYAVI